AGEPLREWIAIESFVADQLRRDFFLESRVEDVVDEAEVVFGAISDANGERKTSAVCNRHDLRRIAGTASSDAGPPFLAPAEVPSMYASMSSTLPRVRKSSRSAARMRFSVPSLTHP